MPFAFMKREWLLHVLNDMRLFGTLAFAFAVAAAGAASASPYRLPDGSTPWPTDHQKALRVAETDPQPYAMNHAEEAAQSLGVKEGKWEAFTPRSSDMPSVKGSLDGGRPMLILQWRPGQ